MMNILKSYFFISFQKNKNYFQKNKAFNTNHVQCFECHGFGHVDFKCANRKLKNKGRTLNATWSDDSSVYSDSSRYDYEKSKFVSFMAITNASSVQGSSDQDSKSGEELDIHDSSDDEQDLEIQYKRLLQDSIRMVKFNAKRALKLKAMGSLNVSLQATLEESQSKVKQLEDQYVILSNNMIFAGEETKQLEDQTQKAKTELDKLHKELIECKSGRDDLAGKRLLNLTLPMHQSKDEYRI